MLDHLKLSGCNALSVAAPTLVANAADHGICCIHTWIIPRLFTIVSKYCVNFDALEQVIRAHNTWRIRPNGCEKVRCLAGTLPRFRLVSRGCLASEWQRDCRVIGAPIWPRPMRRGRGSSTEIQLLPLDSGAACWRAPPTRLRNSKHVRISLWCFYREIALLERMFYYLTRFYHAM
jgi:hypothetical protein